MEKDRWTGRQTRQGGLIHIYIYCPRDLASLCIHCSISLPAVSVPALCALLCRMKRSMPFSPLVCLSLY